MPDRASESNGRLGWMAAACAAAIGLGSSLVLSAGDALFLHRVGPEHLGTAFAVSSGLLVLVLAAVGSRADRGSRASLLFTIAVISAAVLVLAALLAHSAPRIAASVVLIGGKQMSAALELSFWVLLAERFDARQLRRSLPLLIAANGAGLAVGAGGVAATAQLVGVPALALAGAFAFLAAGFLARRVARTGALRPLPRAQLSARKSGFGLASGAAAVRASPVASRLVVLVVLGGAAAPIVHYLLGLRAAETFADEAMLAAFFGGFRAVAQIATVAAQALIASRLISRAGIGSVVICAPVVTLVAAVALLIRPELAAVVIAQAVIKLVDGAIETPAQKLAQNLTSREARGRISGFLDGVAKRAGAVVGGILAAVLAPQAVTVAVAVIALAWLAAAFVFRATFATLAVRELSARRGGETEADDQVSLDRDGLAVLRRALRAGGAAGARARSLLADLDPISVDYSAELTAALAECDSAAAPALAAELSERLDTGHGGTPSRASLEELAASQSSELRVIAARYGVASEPMEPEVSGALALARLRSAGEPSIGDFGDDPLYQRELCRAVANGTLEPGDEGSAARRLARFGRGRFGAAIARSALVSLRRLAVRRRQASRESTEAAAEWMLISAPLMELAEEIATGAGPPGPRAAALELWAELSGIAVALEVATHLGSADRVVARAAARSMRRFGPAAIEALLRVAVFGRRRTREPALDLLAELRVPPAELDELIEREAQIVSESALRLPSLASLENGGLLRQRVEERLAESAHTLFLLIEARLTSSDVGAAARRLRHARHRAARARAIEALDATLPRRFSPLLGALEGTPASERAAAASQYSGDSIPDADSVLRAELRGDDRLARRIAIHALGGAGRSHYAEDINDAAASAYSAADPQEVAARLVSLLDAGDNDRAEMSRSIESVMVLSELPLFSELSTRELAELADVVSWVNARPGDVLMSEGEVGDAMYFVVGGEVLVERSSEGGEKVIARLGRGEPFGEMALFDDEVRSATVTAADTVKLGRIERQAFEEIAREVPGMVLGICRALSRRVRASGE